jgi:heme/copper-type cytochrome/quinol oxidase subunit 2
MIDTLLSILLAMIAVIFVGLAIVGYVAWRSRRRMEDHAVEMADEADQQAKQGGGGGPKPVR